MEQTGAEDEVELGRRRALMGESRKGGGGKRRKRKWRVGWEADELTGVEGRTTTEATRGAEGGSVRGTGGEREEGVARTSPTST